MSDIDSEEGVSDENVPDFHSTQESEISTVPTKAEEAKTGKFLYDIVSGWRKERGSGWVATRHMYLFVLGSYGRWGGGERGRGGGIAS